MVSTDQRVQRGHARRWLTTVSAGTLVLLSGLGFAASWHQSEIVRDVSVAGGHTAAYQEAAYRSAWEMALIEASFTDPDSASRRRVLLADEQTYAATLRLAAVDRAYAREAGTIAARQRSLRQQLTWYLTLLDRGQRAQARNALDTMIKPAYGRIMDRLLEKQSELVDDYVQRQASAERDSTRLAWASLVTFLLSIVVLVLFGRSSRSHRRQVERMAATDALTALPNRSAFTARLRKSLSAGERPTVLTVNIDGFREVNDQLGPRAGDRLLIETARRLASSVREADVVARLGGDEFAILLHDGDTADGETVAARLRDAFHQPFLLDDITVDLEISIGAATAKADDDVTALLRHADIAMHDAKQLHDGFRRFSEENHHDPAARLTQLGDLRRGLDDPDQFTLHYQPKIDVETGALVGVEALARWKHPTKGSIPPNEFIPALETTSLIHRFTDHVLTLALQQTRRWLDAGHRVPVAVNVSTRSLLDLAFPERLAAQLAAAGVPGELLCIEVTEHSVMSDPTTAIEVLSLIRAFGVKTSIDDYGTGYSSMSYLKVLPVDELKIDRSFVADMVADPSSHALVASTIHLGHNLGLAVVAEGVEDPSTVAALAALDCNTAQGYHFDRPLPADELTDRYQLRETAVTAAGR